MHLLLINDDGIDAPGLSALAAVAEQFGRVTVVAPDGHMSGCSHGTTTDKPLTIEQRGPGRFAVCGTPADCARVGLLHLACDADWVLSGINDGANLGVDVYMSGTVAAAREAMLLGRQAIAISQYRKPGRTIDWQRAARDVRAVLSHLFDGGLDRHAFWNVNLPDHDLPDCPALRHCPLDPHPLPLSFERHEGRLVYRSNYHDRKRTPCSDVEACFSGHIAITRLEHFGPLHPSG